MRDFQSLLAEERFWDPHGGEPEQDAILQHPEEVRGLCAFMEAENVRSYLEIGVWTGRLVAALHRIFRFDIVAACDQGGAETRGLGIHLPPQTRFFRGNSESEAFRTWRRDLGPMDLVLIDANHHEAAVRRDWEINAAFPNRFLAFHDITGGHPQTVGVGRFWRGFSGWRHEIGAPGSTMGIGIWKQDP